MTKYRIVECRCPDSTTFYVEYQGFWFWHRVQGPAYSDWIDLTWDSLEAARTWIAAKQVAQAPCITIIHP